MALFSADTTELEDRNKDLQKQLADQRKDSETKEKHKNEILSIEENHREEMESLSDEKKELEVEVIKISDQKTAVELLLSQERESRKLLVDAEVQKQLGQYEMKYYHDLHTFMENHTTKFNEFQQGFMDKTLNVIKELKPVEPKVYIMDKAGSTEAGKPKQEQKGN
jgi:hypothetical protein